MGNDGRRFGGTGARATPRESRSARRGKQTSDGEGQGYGDDDPPDHASQDPDLETGDIFSESDVLEPLLQGGYAFSEMARSAAAVAAAGFAGGVVHGPKRGAGIHYSEYRLIHSHTRSLWKPE